ncbi:hypothetical protein ACWA7J_06415 [Leptothrix sp. BB-4]
MKIVETYAGMKIECWTITVEPKRFRWAYSINDRPPVQMKGADATVEILALKEAKFAAMNDIDKELGRRIGPRD